MFQNENNNPDLIFIHANGFPPSSYNSMFKELKKNYTIDNYLLESLWEEKKEPYFLKDWNLFYNDFKKYIAKNKKKHIGLGHSIGGNIILRTALSNPEYFS